MSTEAGLLIGFTMLLGNAFFVGAEFGLVSARRSNVELEALDGSRAAKITLSAMDQVAIMLAAAQLGVTVCSLVLGAVAEPLIAHLLAEPFHNIGITEGLLHPISLLVALIITVYLHVVIGEMVPKNLALASPTKTALMLTPPLILFVKVSRPLVVALNAIASGILKLFGVKTKKEITSSFSRDEVAGFIKESHREGLLSQDEEHLLSGALSFDERTVQTVILPLENVTYVAPKVTPEEIESICADTGFSRLPVRNAKGVFTGYVHLKDVIGLNEVEHHEPIKGRHIRELINIKSRLSLREALITMQRSGAHLAQVTNKNNKVIGIIALEDVLEELVGVIKDETQT